MAPKKGTKARPLAAAPLGVATQKKKIQKHPFCEATPRSYGVGQSIQPPRDLTWFVKWPRYITLQRQKKILMSRLKVPPALNVFNHPIDKNQAAVLFKLLRKYKPETHLEKKKRLVDEAEARVAGKQVEFRRPVTLKFGINEVTQLVELKKAKLVVIACDCDPVELVCWLPALCRKKEVPYCIVKNKGRLGQLVHMKTCTVVAVENVRKEDFGELELLAKNMRAQYNDNVDLRRKWGGGLLGLKAQHKIEKKEKAIAAEAAKKLGLM